MKRIENRARAIRAILCVTLLTATFLRVAHAQQDSKDAAYFCKGEIAAGLAYSDSLKKWEGNKLPSEGSFSQFTLRLRFLAGHERTNPSGDAQDVSDYEVTIYEVDAKSATPCRSAGTGFVTKIVSVVDDEGNLECVTETRSFKFNLATKRFISAFLHGFVDGIESNDNTPMVTGGTCAEIDREK
jgi:hypothetical protein